ncbi:MAG: acylphosphatase [Sphingomonadaceae bacterium]|nr:acylphosphatase [Sphingomonadaceae bacterium]
MIARRLAISGRVQGVGFRWWAERTARGLGVAGWVRNRHDGTVEAHVEGEVEEVGAFEQRCQQGPRGARVERVEASDAELSDLDGFEQRATE